jgi:tRNA 2-selenouridine synthase
MNQIDNEALYNQSDLVIIDVRTATEYEVNHIFNAINLPVFNEEERHQIGITYKESKVKAQKLGLEYLQTRLHNLLSDLIDKAIAHKQVIVYCARGGMRSGSIVSLLNSMGYDNVLQLKDGMKGHRAYMERSWSSLVDSKTFVVLHGLTGVGKSKLLRHSHADILDLELHAKNAGSVFGYIMFDEKAPSQKYFEESLFYHIKTSDSKYIITESESKRIGRVLLPNILMDSFKSGYHILVTTSLSNRIDNILDDYLNNDEEVLISCINKLRKRISNQKADELIEMLKCGKLKLLVEYLLVDYYDPMYNYSIEQIKYDHYIEYKTLDDAYSTLNFTIERLKNA